MQNIESGKVVAISLTIVDTADNTVLEANPEDRPVLYMHGHDNLIATIEARLEGLELGADFDFTLENAYGDALEGEGNVVPKKEFPKHWHLEPGFSFLAGGTQGQQVRLWVHAVRGSRVVVAAEHPWGGRTVRFTGKVLHVRNATMEERQHGHAHGPGGHQH